MELFLKWGAKLPDLVPEQMVTLHPYYAYARHGHYALHTADKIDVAACCGAISLVTGRAVTGVRFVSLTDPYPPPVWMPATASAVVFRPGQLTSVRREVLSGIGNCTGQTLSSALSVDVNANLGGRLSDDTRVRIAYRLHTVVQPPLLAGLGTRVMEAFGNYVWTRCLSVPLYTFVGFTLLGDDAGLRRLTPMMELLPKAIPLGETRGEEGVWLVLAA
jgi:hypothetical protein